MMESSSSSDTLESECVQCGDILSVTEPDLLTALIDHECRVQYCAVQRLVQLLCQCAQSPHSDPIEQLMSNGQVLARLVVLLGQKCAPMQAECARVMALVAEHHNPVHRGTLVECGAVLALIQSLNCTNDVSLVDWTLSALQHIVNDCLDFRDYTLDCGLLVHIIRVLDTMSSSQSVSHKAIAVLCILCYSLDPGTHFHKVSDALSVLTSVVLHSSDPVMLAHGCLCLAHLSLGGEWHIAAVIESGDGALLARLVTLVGDPNCEVQSTALRVMYNVSTGSCEHKRTLLAAGVLAAVRPLIDHNQTTSVLQTVCWTLTNLVSGSRNLSNRIAALFEAAVMPLVVTLELHSRHWQVRLAAAQVIDQVVRHCTRQHILLLYQWYMHSHTTPYSHLT